MNLYQVCDSTYDWMCFVFDTSRNRAKMRTAQYFGQDYIDMRCKTLSKGVNVPTPVVVDGEYDEAYQAVLSCGYRYYSEEELADMVEEWLNEPLFANRAGKGADDE